MRSRANSFQERLTVLSRPALETVSRTQGDVAIKSKKVVKKATKKISKNG